MSNTHIHHLAMFIVWPSSSSDHIHLSIFTHTQWVLLIAHIAGHFYWSKIKTFFFIRSWPAILWQSSLMALLCSSFLLSTMSVFPCISLLHFSPPVLSDSSVLHFLSSISLCWSSLLNLLSDNFLCQFSLAQSVWILMWSSCDSLSVFTRFFHGVRLGERKRANLWHLSGISLGATPVIYG